MKLFVMVVAVIFPALSQQAQIKLDVSATKVNFTLGDVLHTVHGTFKLTKGDLWFEPSSSKAGGELVVNGASGDSGSHARDSRMEKNILQADLYPEIKFAPNRIEGKVNLSGQSEFRLQGLFSIHGGTHELTMNVKSEIQGDRVKATASFDVPYVKWGMKNPSTLLLRVNGTVPIAIQAVGRISNNSTFRQAPEGAAGA
jgi:polyisoprenoid-binding protein YceI